MSENYPQVPVLDHGYVQLVEHWGEEERIIEAARMSTGKGFKGWGTAETPGDEKLLKFLYEHHHSTPFEMAGMVIEVKAPIFVFREWHRHRTQCLAGDTLITCVTPNNTTFKRTIKEIFDLKHGGVADSAPSKHKNGYSKAGTPVFREARRKDIWRIRVLPNCQDRILRVLNEETGEFQTAKMEDVWESGEKELFALEAGGRVVRASSEHPFFTKRGWVKMHEIIPGDQVARMGKVAAQERPIPPIVRQAIGVWTTMMRSRIMGAEAPCYLCKKNFFSDDLQLDHVVPVVQDLAKALDKENLKPVCYPCHRNKTDREQPFLEGKTKRGVRWEKVLRTPQAVGREMTYDIAVEGPNHNYLANDLVVHNSYNEMSARYTPLPNENYIPSVERLLINSKTNKQAGTIKGADELNGISAEWFRQGLIANYEQSENLYQQALAWGVPKELARVHLPVGRYSRMRASANLRNWLAFLTLRMDPAAQFEIRQFANEVGKLVEKLFPRTWDLFQAT